MQGSSGYAKGLLILTLGLLVGAVFHWKSADAQRNPTNRTTESEMLMTSSTAADGGLNVVLIDPQQRVISSYHVAGDSGGITLRSVRNIRWDMLMDEFNSGDPKPREIKTLLEQN